MIVRLLVAAAVIAALIWLLRWFARTPPPQVRSAMRKALLYGGGGLLVLLALTGRLHWLFALIGGAAPFAQRLFAMWRAFQRLKVLKGGGAAGGGIFGQRSASADAGQTSDVETRWLHLTLDHDTGALTGVVMNGPMQGRRLEDLGLDELLQLLHQCRMDDQESAILLESYLDRTHDQWRDHEAGDTRQDAAASSSAMTTDDAYRLLGLEPGATDAEIKAAHRRLIQKVHPDHGGSAYLASQINMAKDLLLGK